MSDFKYLRILQAVNAHPWAILPEKLAIIQDLLTYRAQGFRLTDEEIREQLAGEGVELEAAANGRLPISANGTAIIPILGTIVRRGGMFTEMSGAVSVQGLAAKFNAAMKDPDVERIVLDVDSPGGQVGGVEELARDIFKARGTKPITAVVNSLAASAAYWIASAADEMVITPSGQAGSIGVFAMHQDISRAVEAKGVTVSLVSAGKFKTEGNPFEPLTEESRAAIQEMVDLYYVMFTTAVARNRGVSRIEVVNGFGEGRVVGADKAVALGMADRVATLAEVLSSDSGNRRSRRAALANARRQIQIEQLKGDYHG